jgi:hypothetical protein
MKSPKSTDKLFWGKEFKDFLNWIKQLKMAFKVHGYDEIKFFKIEKLNLQGKAKDWFKKLQAMPTNWNEMKIGM